MELALLGVGKGTLTSFIFFIILTGLGSTDQDPYYSFLKHATQAPRKSYYDYIIVGGGTAGCPLAATLSEHYNVLLLERGGSPYGNKNITHPTSIIDTLIDASPTSPAQGFVTEDGVLSARARVLGGGTAINVGFYNRPSPDQVREMGFDETLANESFHWVEKAIASRPQPLQWQSALKDGLVEAGVTPDNGFAYDHIVGTKIGGSILDAGGRRHTAADLLEYADTRRLTVLLHATASKILFQHEGKGRPAARGVVFRDADGSEHTAYLNHGHHGGEVIVSAGAIGSPQLLMLSGIGPADQLRSLGIDLVVDHPMVGQGMTDNPMNFLIVPSPSPVETAPGQVAGITPSGSYIAGLSGLNLSAVISEGVKYTGVPSHGFHISGGSIVWKVPYPLSRGHLRLVSKNPEDTPSVTFNYFTEPEDLQVCVEGLKVISRLLESKAFSEFKYPGDTVETLIQSTARTQVNFRAHRDGDHKGVTSLEQYCNETVVTMWHYHGGCQVGRVVDHDLRVVGVDAVRVVDGSVFNFSPGVTPQATVMMLGRYMGVKIQNERRARKGPLMCDVTTDGPYGT